MFPPKTDRRHIGRPPASCGRIGGGREIVGRWPARIASLPDLLPPLIVIGSLYAEVAAPMPMIALLIVFPQLALWMPCNLPG